MTYRFKDIKKFLENAPVDEYGYYEFGKDYPKYVIQIYHTKHECNVIYKTSVSPADEEIIGKLYFDCTGGDNRVHLYNVARNIVDFDNRVDISSDTAITPILIHKAFHGYGRRMYEVLNLILETEYIKGENKMGRKFMVGHVIIDGEVFTWNAEVFDEPSKYGINNGRISKLEILLKDSQKDSRYIVCLYDREWIFEPKMELTKRALDKILAMFPDKKEED